MRRAARLAALGTALALLGVLSACSHPRRALPPSTTATTRPAALDSVVTVPAPAGDRPPPSLVGCRSLPSKSSTSAPKESLPPLPVGVRWLSASSSPVGPTYVAAIPENLNRFQRRVAEAWAAAGWATRSSRVAEGQQLEVTVESGKQRLALSARNDYCLTTWTLVRLTIG